MVKLVVTVAIGIYAYRLYSNPRHMLSKIGGRIEDESGLAVPTTEQWELASLKKDGSIGTVSVRKMTKLNPKAVYMITEGPNKGRTLFNCPDEDNLCAAHAILNCINVTKEDIANGYYADFLNKWREVYPSGIPLVKLDQLCRFLRIPLICSNDVLTDVVDPKPCVVVWMSDDNSIGHAMFLTRKRKAKISCEPLDFYYAMLEPTVADTIPPNLTLGESTHLTIGGKGTLAAVAAAAGLYAITNQDTSYYVDCEETPTGCYQSDISCNVPIEPKTTIYTDVKTMLCAYTTSNPGIRSKGDKSDPNSPQDRNITVENGRVHTSLRGSLSIPQARMLNQLYGVSTEKLSQSTISHSGHNFLRSAIDVLAVDNMNIMIDTARKAMAQGTNVTIVDVGAKYHQNSITLSRVFSYGGAHYDDVDAALPEVLKEPGWAEWVSTELMDCLVDHSKTSISGSAVRKAVARFDKTKYTSWIVLLNRSHYVYFNLDEETRTLYHSN